MKKLILALILFSSCASAEVTMHWYMLPPVDVWKWIVYCAPVGESDVQPVTYVVKARRDITHVMHGYPNGEYTCRVKAFSEEAGEFDSDITTFTVVNEKLDTGDLPLPKPPEIL